ncbi:MAG: outer membrane protein transport protein [Rhodoferax sp.]|nr:outer membrane protein transport protein [Rhodoferax sp.]
MFSTPLCRYALAVGTALFATSGATFASSFALVETSASGLGNAYAGAAAIADDAGTVWWNPAGMTRLDAPTASLALHAITPSAKFSNGNSQPSCVAPGVCRPLGGMGADAGETAWVPATYIVLPINKSLALGLGISAPFGLKNEYESDWLGRYQAIKSDMKTININPSLAFKVNDRISLGVGISYQKIDAELTSVVNPGAVMGLAAQSGAIPAALVPSVLGTSLGVADVNATLKGNDSAYGYNLGIMLNLSPATRLGLSYRSAIAYTIKGDVTFNIPTVPATSPASGVIAQVLAALQQPGQRLASGPIRGSLKTPDSFSLSTASDLNSQLQLLADVSWTGWSNIPKLEFVRTDGTILNSVEYKWKDTWRYSLGANYKLNDKLMLRSGVAYDETPMDTLHRTPRLPDGDRTWLSIGARYLVQPNMALDFGYTHISFKDPKIDNRNDGSTAAYGSVDGTYSSNVNIFSAGLSYTFK